MGKEEKAQPLLMEEVLFLKGFWKKGFWIRKKEKSLNGYVAAYTAF